MSIFLGSCCHDAVAAVTLRRRLTINASNHPAEGAHQYAGLGRRIPGGPKNVLIEGIEL